MIKVFVNVQGKWSVLEIFMYFYQIISFIQNSLMNMKNNKLNPVRIYVVSVFTNMIKWQHLNVF